VLLKSKPVRTVLWSQAAVTGAIALLAWPFGTGAALSAGLGGAINIVAGIAFFAVSGLGRPGSAGGVVELALRAEACKILVVIGALWAALSTFKGIHFVPFASAFTLTALLPSVGMLVRDDSGDPTRAH
jgi:ATP synthase protein I